MHPIDTVRGAERTETDKALAGVFELFFIVYVYACSFIHTGMVLGRVDTNTRK